MRKGVDTFCEKMKPKMQIVAAKAIYTWPVSFEAKR